MKRKIKQMTYGELQQFLTQSANEFTLDDTTLAYWLDKARDAMPNTIVTWDGFVAWAAEMDEHAWNLAFGDFVAVEQREELPNGFDGAPAEGGAA